MRDLSQRHVHRVQVSSRPNKKRRNTTGYKKQKIYLTFQWKPRCFYCITRKKVAERACAAFLHATLVCMYWRRKTNADSTDLLWLSKNESECQSGAEDSSAQKAALTKMPGEAVFWNGGNLICCVSHWKVRCYINGSFWRVCILNSQRHCFHEWIWCFLLFSMQWGIVAGARPKIRTASLLWIWKSVFFHLNS